MPGDMPASPASSTTMGSNSLPLPCRDRALSSRFDHRSFIDVCVDLLLPSLTELSLYSPVRIRSEALSLVLEFVSVVVVLVAVEACRCCHARRRVVRSRTPSSHEPLAAPPAPGCAPARSTSPLDAPARAWLRARRLLRRSQPLLVAPSCSSRNTCAPLATAGCCCILLQPSLLLRYGRPHPLAPALVAALPPQVVAAATWCYCCFNCLLQSAARRPQPPLPVPLRVVPRPPPTTGAGRRRCPVPAGAWPRPQPHPSLPSVPP
ncbi:hypothetical protein ZWY2020_034558 [Hordeum vulgare]|nr:hypothetical protein ZWY2020_034558 [Hordeum vulgare]